MCDDESVESDESDDESDKKTDVAVEKFGAEIMKTVGATKLSPGKEYAVSKEN